jgi:quercetin dioxygenase-like cupin family protein
MHFFTMSLRAMAASVALIGSFSASAQESAKDTSSAAQAPKNPAVGDPNRVVPILQEPRHRQVHRDGDIYVLDIQINPGDMTLQHTHNAPILYNFISSGKGPSDGRLSSNTEYVTKQFTHQVSNEGPGLFRIIALTNYGPAIADLKADRPTGMSGEPEIENPWLRAYSMTLAPGKSTELQKHHNPSTIVQVTDGLVHVTREDGITSELTSMGSWAWRNAHSSYQVRNVGTAPVKIVVNEARRAK